MATSQVESVHRAPRPCRCRPNTMSRNVLYSLSRGSYHQMCDLGPHLSRICDKRRTAFADLFTWRRSLPRLVDCIRRQDRRGKALTHPSCEDRLSHEGLFARYLVFTLLLTLLIYYARFSVAHSRLQCKCFRPQDLRFEGQHGMRLVPLYDPSCLAANFLRTVKC